MLNGIKFECSPDELFFVVVFISCSSLSRSLEIILVCCNFYFDLLSWSLSMVLFLRKIFPTRYKKYV